MIGYASRTGTRRNLDALRTAGWRLMVTPISLRPEGMRYALDNGAWAAHCSGHPWNADAFLRAVAKLGAQADFIVLPDIVGAGQASLRRSLTWLPFLLGSCGRLLIPVQDGLEPRDISHLIGQNIGIFVGGSTAWKLKTLGQWGQLAARTRSYLHVGRVNTQRRIARCAAAGADSFDGTSVSRFAKTLPELDPARRQGGLKLYA